MRSAAFCHTPFILTPPCDAPCRRVRKNGYAQPYTQLWITLLSSFLTRKFRAEATSLSTSVRRLLAKTAVAGSEKIESAATDDRTTITRLCQFSDPPGSASHGNRPPPKVNLIEHLVKPFKGALWTKRKARVFVQKIARAG